MNPQSVAPYVSHVAILLVTGMKIAVPACSAGIGLVPAYGATIRD